VVQGFVGTQERGERNLGQIKGQKGNQGVVKNFVWGGRGGGGSNCWSRILREGKGVVKEERVREWEGTRS